MATRTSPQGSAGSSPHHISGTIEAMVAFDEPVHSRGVPEQVRIPEQFGGGRLLGTEVDNFRPGVCRDIHTRWAT